MNELLRAFPQAKWHQYEPANGDNRRAGAVMAFGQPVNTTYRFDLAQRVLSIDADFLSAMPGTLRYARDFFARRRITETNREMNRLFDDVFNRFDGSQPHVGKYLQAAGYIE